MQVHIRRTPPSRARRAIAMGGYTLVELMLVVVVMAIVAAMALPRLNLEGYKVSSAVRGITASLSYAQRLAVSLQHDVRVAFDVTANRLRVHEDLNNDGLINGSERVTYTNLEDGVVFGRGTATPVVYTTGGTGTQTINLTLTQATWPVIVFRRDGSASENGGFYINTRRGIANATDEWVRGAEIIRSTGRVIWYSYATGTWVQGN